MISGQLTLFRMVGVGGGGGGGGGGGKGLPTSFFLVTSTNVKIGPYNFLNFRFNAYDTIVQNFKFVPSASLISLNLN